MGASPTSLDPHTSFDDVTSVVLGNVYEPLVQFDRNLRLGPGLALRWINPDDRTWRFFLDPQARFPDRAPLLASDVRFSIERVGSVAGSQLTGFVRHVSRVTVVDDHTVDVHTDQPVAILNGLALIPIVSERHTRAVGDALRDRPLGTGPYKVTEWKKGSRIVLEATPYARVSSEVHRAEFDLRLGGQDMLEHRIDSSSCIGPRPATKRDKQVNADLWAAHLAQRTEEEDQKIKRRK